MDTSNSTTDFRIMDLLGSLNPEDQKLGEKAKAVIVEIVSQLKPILRYVCVPTEFRDTNGIACGIGTPQGTVRRLRTIPLMRYAVHTGHTLFLDEKGNFLSACICTHHLPHYHELASSEGQTNGFPFARASFPDLLESLNRVLKDALRSREAHLATLQTRSDMMDRILEVVKTSVPK